MELILYFVYNLYHHFLILKGKPHDIEESAILEGYRCANEKCTGFLLRDPGMLRFNLGSLYPRTFLDPSSPHLFTFAEEKGFVCQKCLLLRSKEEVKKLASDLKTVSEKAPTSPSAEGICCLCFLNTCIYMSEQD